MKSLLSKHSGIYAQGSQGVELALDILTDKLKNYMQMTGCTDIEQINEERVVLKSSLAHL